MTDHDHAAQIAAYGRCIACIAAPTPPPVPTGPERRDDALLAVETGSPLSWLIQARRVIRELAATGEPFTSDDVWARLDHPPEPRALGAAIRTLAIQGEIRTTGRTRPSTRPECHARPVAIWVGTQPVDRSVEEPSLWDA